MKRQLINYQSGKQIPQEKLDAFKQVTTTDNIDQQKHIIKSIDDDPKGTISPTAILKGCSGLRRCYSPDKTPVPYNPKTQDKKDITNE